MANEDMLARIQKKLDSRGSVPAAEALSEALPPSDLSTLMLAVYGRITARTAPPELLRLYGQNAYAKASKLSALALARQELALLELAEDRGIGSVVLSPAAQLGTCSAVAAVNQNKVLSAVRGTELSADPTNALALHICHLLKGGGLANRTAPVSLCATARVVRAQRVTRSDLVQHFSLYGMVTSGRDSGSYGFERAALEKHIAFYRDFFRERIGAGISLVLRKCPGYADPDGLFTRLEEWLRTASPAVPLCTESALRDNRYYAGVQFTLFAHLGGEDINIGDGGFVDWSQKLLGSHKERMLISAIGLDRLCMYMP